MERCWLTIGRRQPLSRGQSLTAAAKKKAIVAVGHSILTIVWQLLSDGATFVDLGSDYYESLWATSTAEPATTAGRELRALGYNVTIETAA